MVDCEVLTEFSKHVFVDNNRLLLQSKNCDYTIEIAFSNKQCRKIPKGQSSIPLSLKKIPIKAVYGIIDMEVNPYLAVVTKATVIGQIYHRKVFQMQKMEFLCLSPNKSNMDSIYLKGLESIFASKFFYFSQDYDLTNSLQEFINCSCLMNNKRMEYMYNSDWVDQFIKIKAYEWITGFICGFVSITFNHGVNNACEMALISRRDKRRQGMRWLTRGCDLDGNTANTAQTQLVFFTDIEGKEFVFSHVQLRGSIPFLWSQDPDLRWEPKCIINPNDKLNAQLLLKNYENIKKSYPNGTMINLIDRKRIQMLMGNYFQKIHNELGDPAMKHIWFDFHSECKNMKYQNLAKLLDMAKAQIENYGYFHMEVQASGVGDSRLSSKKNTQKGVFRINCMDCLDRTNVVQSVIARQLLLSWLFKLGFQNKPRSVSPFERLSETLEQNFRSQWTKNADALSILYSGTPAMKTDFTAVGKRTNKGALKDGVSAIKRFFLGNFYDSREQDFIDFSLNKLKPKRNPKDRIRHSPTNSLYIIVLLIIIVPIAICYGVDAMTDHETRGVTAFKLVGSVLGILIVMKMVQIMGNLFIRKPIRHGFY